MMAWLSNLLRSPSFEDDEQTRRAALAYPIAWVMACAATLYVIVRALEPAEAFPFEIVGPMLLGALLSVWTLVLIRRGKVRAAALMLVGLMWTIVAFLALTSEAGIRDTTYVAMLVVIVLASSLMGSGGGLIVVGVSLILGAILVYMEVSGRRAYVVADSAQEFLRDYVLFFTLTLGIMVATNRGFERLVARVRRSEDTLRARNQELQQAQATLEVRVAERTSELNRQAAYLRAAAQVATIAGEILDVGELMGRVVELVVEQFGLSFAGLFTLDGAGEYAVLRAGTGEAGSALLARTHRLRVGEGMVGWAIAQNESRVAQRVEDDTQRVNVAELAAIRSEAALPLRARGRVIGAMTVQSDQADFFSEDALTVLQTAADLVAVALSNAELYEESVRSAETARRAYGEISAAVWRELMESRRDWGYSYRAGVVREVSGPWRPELQQVLETGQRAVAQHPDGGQRAILPIVVRGSVVGVIDYGTGSDGGVWQAETLALLAELTEQVGQALDSARLLETSRLRAAQEAQLNEVVAAFAASLDVDTMLKTAVRELGKLPGVAEVAVHMAAGLDGAGSSGV